MNEKIEKLRAAIEHDQERIRAIQEGIAEKEKKLRELEVSEIQGKIMEIRSKNMDVWEILDAIRDKDVEKLMELTEEEAEHELDH